MASKRIEWSFSKKGFLLWKREEREEKKFSLHGKGICTRRRIREFIPEPNSFFFRRFLITSSPLREKSSKREKCLLERGKTGERRRQTCRRKSVINSTEGEEFVERRERERRRESRAKPITRNQGIITVASERHKSDTNRVSRFNASSPLWRVIHPSLPPFTKKRDKERERERETKRRRRRRKMEGSLIPLGGFFFSGWAAAGWSVSIPAKRFEEPVEHSGGNNYINGVGRKPPLDTSVDAHPFSPCRLALLPPRKLVLPSPPCASFNSETRNRPE